MSRTADLEKNEDRSAVLALSMNSMESSIIQTIMIEIVLESTSLQQSSSEY